MANAGTYLILFEASVDEAGQLVLAVNGAEVPSTVVGRGTGTSQIVGMTIQTLTAGSTLEVRNPTSSNTALTITPNAGGDSPVNTHLIVIQLA